MKNRFTIFLTAALIGLAGYTAYAESVTISTFYPSPYGSYQTLEVVGAASIGSLNMTGNRSTIYTTGDNTTTHRGGIQMVTYDNGLNTILTPTDASGTTLSSTVRFGGSGAFNSDVVNVTSSGVLTANNEGASANAIVSNGNLSVNGNASFTVGGQTGNLVQSCSGGNCYTYAVYA